MTAQTVDRKTVSTADVDEVIQYAPMADYIAEVTVIGWARLTPSSPEFLRKSVYSDVARGVAEDVYRHNIERGAKEADAIADASAVLAKTFIRDANDELTKQLRAEVRNYAERG